MARPARRLHQEFTTRGDQPLIGIPTSEDGEEVVYYFNDEDEADRTFPSDRAGIQRALSLAGAWQELDTDDGPDPLDELDRMRHESKPTPPLEL
jgi:hypothetical protein